jgi:hypothetical protein
MVAPSAQGRCAPLRMHALWTRGKFWSRFGAGWRELADFDGTYRRGRWGRRANQEPKHISATADDILRRGCCEKSVRAMQTSTFSSRAKGRSARAEPVYDKCPLCGSPDIKLGFERVEIERRPAQRIDLRVRSWACPKCGERFLTASARHQIDAALGLEHKGRTGS